MNNQIEELKNKLQQHRNSLAEVEMAIADLEQKQAKPLTGLIKDPEYRGDCFFAFADGVVHQPTLTGACVFALNQGRAFYDEKSAKRFREHEQLQYALACATESGPHLYFLSWNTKEDKIFIGYYSCLYVRFGFKSRSDAEKFTSNYTTDQIKLMLGVGL